LRKKYEIIKDLAVFMPGPFAQAGNGRCNTEGGEGI